MEPEDVLKLTNLVAVSIVWLKIFPQLKRGNPLRWRRGFKKFANSEDEAY